MKFVTVAYYEANVIRLLATFEAIQSMNLVVVLLIPLSEFLEDRARESKNEADL